MTIKELLMQEIESSADPLLEETLDFLRFLKTKQTKSEKQLTPTESEVKATTVQTDLEKKSTDAEQVCRPASGRILRHADSQAGDDFEQIS